MNDIGKEAAFSIFTGDVIEGATWLVDENEATDDLEEWNEQMATGLEVLPMFPAIGRCLPIGLIRRTGLILNWGFQAISTFLYNSYSMLLPLLTIST